MKKLNIKNILVPIDFSRMSIQAIELAKAFAKRFGATVHLAHAHEFFYPAGFAGPASPILPYPVLTYDSESEKRAGRELIEIAKRSGLSSTTTHVLCGSPPFEEICRLARNLPTDLIVMPTHGRTGLKHVVLGSTAERIVQHSPCPVLVVRDQKRQSKNGSRISKTILVPVDFSHCSLAGLKYAIGFADKVGAKLILLHVVAYHYVTNGWVTYELTEATRTAEKEAEQQMKKFLSDVKFGGVRFETAIVNGNSVDKICDYAREHEVDLIVTSTHGRTGFNHVLIGSVAENVVRRAPCSVVAVPSFPRARTTEVIRGHATFPRETTRPASTKVPRSLIEREKLTRKRPKLTAHPFPERRKMNRFRETRLVQ